MYHRKPASNMLIGKVCQKVKRMKKGKSLALLSPGESGRVIAILCEGEMRRRLLDIGMIPGTEICCVGRSPFGDPSAYLVRGKLIAIRKEDAKRVVI